MRGSLPVICGRWGHRESSPDVRVKFVLPRRTDSDSELESLAGISDWGRESVRGAGAGQDRRLAAFTPARDGDRPRAGRRNAGCVATGTCGAGTRGAAAAGHRAAAKTGPRVWSITQKIEALVSWFDIFHVMFFYHSCSATRVRKQYGPIKPARPIPLIKEKC